MSDVVSHKTYMTVWVKYYNEVDYVNRLKIYYWMEYGTEMEDGLVLKSEIDDVTLDENKYSGFTWFLLIQSM